MLRPGGRVLIWDVDWATVSWHSEDPARMERFLRAWDEHLADPTLPRTLAARMRAAGFEDVEMQGHVFATDDVSEETYAGALVPMMAGFVGTDEAQEWAAEQRELTERGESYFACIQFCFTGTRPANVLASTAYAGESQDGALAWGWPLGQDQVQVAELVAQVAGVARLPRTSAPAGRAPAIASSIARCDESRSWKPDSRPSTALIGVSGSITRSVQPSRLAHQPVLCRRRLQRPHDGGAHRDHPPAQRVAPG